MNPNVLFVLYCLIAFPIALSLKNTEGFLYSVGEFIGIALIPAILVAIYNFKKNSKPLRITARIVIIVWILITVFGTLGKFQQQSKSRMSQPGATRPPFVDPFATNK
jgi:hypothetical protein